MADDFRELEIALRKEGDLRTKKQIAKRMKSLAIFNDDFIADIVELDKKTVSRLKGENHEFTDTNKAVIKDKEGGTMKLAYVHNKGVYEE